MKLTKTHFCLPEFYTADDESANYKEEYLKNCEEHAIAVAKSCYLISDTTIGSDLLDDFEHISELKSIIHDLGKYIGKRFCES